MSWHGYGTFCKATIPDPGRLPIAAVRVHEFENVHLHCKINGIVLLARNPRSCSRYRFKAGVRGDEGGDLRSSSSPVSLALMVVENGCVCSNVVVLLRVRCSEATMNRSGLMAITRSYFEIEFLFEDM
jgi:hypothetical protein